MPGGRGSRRGRRAGTGSPRGWHFLGAPTGEKEPGARPDLRVRQTTLAGGKKYLSLRGPRKQSALNQLAGAERAPPGSRSKVPWPPSVGWDLLHRRAVKSSSCPSSGLEFMTHAHLQQGAHPPSAALRRAGRERRGFTPVPRCRAHGPPPPPSSARGPIRPEARPHPCDPMQRNW